MTEAEVLEAIALYNTNTASYMAIYMSLTFAYLTVAYFVGASLSLFQTRAVSTLYAVWSTTLSFGVFANTQAWEELMSLRPTMLDKLPVYAYGSWHLISAVILPAGIILSLYFMFDVRKKYATNAVD